MAGHVGGKRGDRASESTQPGAPSFLTVALHVFALCGFAIAQPVFDVISRNPTYLVAHGMSAGGVLAFSIGLIVVPATIAVAIVAFFPDRLRLIIVSLFVGVLFCLAVSPPMTRSLQLPDAGIDLFFVVVAVAGAVAYARLEFLRRYLIWLAPAPLLFAFGFLVFGPASALFTAPHDPIDGSTGQGASVVHVVLDELSLGSILKTDGTIDSRRFPNIARLARTSTWYRNATTNSNVTRHAVPTALTGLFPKTGKAIPPTAGIYPHNLFSLLAPTHRLHSNETVTSLCSIERCRKRGLAASAVKHVFADTAIVYLQGSMPPTIRKALPPLPEAQWAGFFDNPLTVHERVKHFPRPLQPLANRILTAISDTGQKPYSPEVRRFNSFLASIDATRAPSVWFHHALLPHQPWHLTEDAVPYDDQRTRGFLEGHWYSQAAAEEALQRYLVQLKGTDQLVGRLVDRLRIQGRWENTVLVVHADHGLTFTNRLYYRAITGAEGDVLRVPLFIKFPGQRKGKIDERNVELVDILPTVAEAVDVRMPWTVDGRSLLRPGERRLKRVWHGARPAIRLPSMTTVEAPRTSRQIAKLFGAGRKVDDIYAMGPFRDLVGDRAADHRSDNRRTANVGLIVDRPERIDAYDSDAPFVPARIAGSFENTRRWQWVAVAVNGRIAGLTRPESSRGRSRFFVLLSKRLLHTDTNSLTFYGVDNHGELSRF